MYFYIMGIYVIMTYIATGLIYGRYPECNAMLAIGSKEAGIIMLMKRVGYG